MMKSLQTWKYRHYLAWLGPFFLTMGLTAGLVAGRWSVLPLSLLGLGLLICLGWLLTRTSGLRQMLSQRSTQEGTNAAIATVAVLCIFVFVNMLGDRLNHRIDLTENQIFTLAPQTVELVQTLEQPTRVVVFDVAPNAQDRDLLQTYRQRNPTQFNYEYLDPQLEPGIAQRFGVQTFGEVHVEQGDRRQLVQTVNAGERLTERRLTNALARITSDRQSRIYFLQGHGERLLQPGEGGLSETLANLEADNFSVETLNLAENPRVPSDAAVVVLAGPERSLLPEEIDALQQFQQRRSGLLVMVDPQVNPELEPLLDDWGVRLSDRLLYDPVAGRDGVVTVVTAYGPHPITQELQNGISFYPLARPLEISNSEEVQVTPLLITSPETQARRIDDEGNLLPPDSTNEPAGEMALGAAFSRPIEAEDTAGPAEAAEADSLNESDDAPPEARLVVIGNSTFATDGLVNQQVNKDVFLNAINWLSQDDGQSFAVRPAEPINRRITLSNAQQIWLALGSTALLPLFGLVMAIALWWRRR